MSAVTISHAVDLASGKLVAHGYADSERAYACPNCNRKLTNAKRRIRLGNRDWWWTHGKHLACAQTAVDMAIRSLGEKIAIDLIVEAIRAWQAGTGSEPSIRSNRIGHGTLSSFAGADFEVKTELTLEWERQGTVIRRRPDIALIATNGTKLLIEVWFSHRCEDEKYLDYHREGLTWIEVEAMSVQDKGPLLLTDVALLPVQEEAAGEINWRTIGFGVGILVAAAFILPKVVKALAPPKPRTSRNVWNRIMLWLSKLFFPARTRSARRF